MILEPRSCHKVVMHSYKKHAIFEGLVIICKIVLQAVTFISHKVLHFKAKYLVDILILKYKGISKIAHYYMQNMKLYRLFYTIFFASYTYAYYGLPEKPVNLTLGIFPASYKIGPDIYSYGGFDMEDDQYITTQLSIDSEKSLNVKNITSIDLAQFCYFCFGFVMNDSSVLILTGSHLTLYTSGSTGKNISTSYYNPIENTAIETTLPPTSPVIPTERIYNQAVITPDNNSIYIFGGISNFQDALNQKNYLQLSQNLTINQNILKLDIASNSYTNITNFTFVGGTATMLPSGVVVLAFGAYGLNNETGHFSLYDPSSLFLFDTKTNTLTTQKISGNPPHARAEASGTLGSEFDVTGSYDQEHGPYIITRSQLFSDVVVLNTRTWTWFSPNVSGPPSDARFGHFSLLHGNNSLIIGGGATRYSRLNDISVLRNLPVTGESISVAKLQWFTNSEADDAYSKNIHNPKSTLNTGEIIAIVIGCLVAKLPGFRRVLYTAHHKLIWNPRSGEPFWTEVLRVIVRFILLGGFLAFTVYVIIRATNSPSINQEQVEDWDEMPVPDVRICTDAPLGLNITCEFSTGEDCSSYIHPINQSYLPDKSRTPLGCYIFVPPTNLYFKSSLTSYEADLRDSLDIRLYRPNVYDTVEIIYYSYYSAQYDPFRKLLGLRDDVSMLTHDQAANMLLVERVVYPSPITFISGHDIAVTTTFTLKENNVLNNNSWNVIGFAYQYETTLDMIQNVGPKTSITSSINTTWNPFSVLTIKPNDYEFHIVKEQKVATILSGLAQAGGVFSLFIAIQALLFGFRPDSPWGVVHRWTFGSQRRTLTDQLTNQFENLKTPVPMVTPVHSRFYMTNNGRTSNSTFDAMPPDNLEENEEARLQRMEDRLQLMEVLFKTYYINDEIFYQLNEARKHGENRSNSSLDRSDEETLMKRIHR
ncbi:hypothetical protein K501DRAFT_279110 [Backusella circina FSU 941]|nr:hypothetical protein K501DRAFT_279110 [Backusella circina FSU 941]